LYVRSVAINVHKDLIWWHTQEFMLEKNLLYVRSVVINVHIDLILYDT
jgi:hypothetical protein